MTTNQLVEKIKTTQTKLEAVKKVFDELNTALTKNEGEKSEAHITAENIPKMRIEKQNLLAESALGKSVSQGDMARIDADIAAAVSAVEHHEQLVEGLKSKLTEATTTKSNLEDTLIFSKREYIEKEAENIHQEYMKQAVILLATFRRLLALSRLSTGIGGNPLCTGDAHKVIAIPVFNFASSGQLAENYSGLGCRWLPATEIANPVVYAQADEDAERAKIVKLGFVI